MSDMKTSFIDNIQVILTKNGYSQNAIYDLRLETIK